MQQPVDNNDQDMDGEGHVSPGAVAQDEDEDAQAQKSLPERQPKNATYDGEDEEDSSLGATLGMIVIALMVCVGIGVGVYFGVAAILNSVKQNRILAQPEKNSTADNGPNKVETTKPTTTTTTVSTTTTTTTTIPPNRMSSNLYKCNMSEVKLRGENWNWQVRLVNEPITTNETETYFAKHDRNATRHENVNTVCSGVIVSNITILTSAECCHNVNMTETQVYVGNDYDVYYERSVVDFKIHEEFERGLEDDHANGNDLCLIKIDRDILVSGGEVLDTDAICMPPIGTKHLSSETKCFAAGYGSLKSGYDPNQDDYRVFDETELSLFSDRNCRRSEQSSSGFKESGNN